MPLDVKVLLEEVALAKSVRNLKTFDIAKTLSDEKLGICLVMYRCLYKIVSGAQIYFNNIARLFRFIKIR
jgi:hypothetical protein